MRKLIIAVTIIAGIFLCVMGLDMLMEWGGNLVTVITYETEQSQTQFNYVKFKSVPENTTLLNAVLSVNDTFLSEPVTQHKTRLEKSYALVNFFPSFSSYYTAKKKIEQSIFSEVPNLLPKIKDASRSDLETFLEENSRYLDKYLGITDIDTLDLLAFSLSSIDSPIIGCYVVPDSVVYNSYDNSSLFNLAVVMENNKKILLSVNARFESSSENQNSPEIQINGSFGAVTE